MTAATETEFENAIDELESLLKAQYIGVRTSTQLKLSLASVRIIIEALKPRESIKD